MYWKTQGNEERACLKIEYKNDCSVGNRNNNDEEVHATEDVSDADACASVKWNHYWKDLELQAVPRSSERKRKRKRKK